MSTAQPTTAPNRAVSSLIPLELDTQDVRQLARALAAHPQQPQPQFLVDCAHLKALHTRGVSHVVSQLLAVRRSGAGVWLRNVSPTLARCLRLLQLEPLFPTVS
jgi:anti-anti-sigma regulatory factor